MLTQAESPVDATPPEAMWSISRVAERDKISKQAVSKRAKLFAAERGLIVSRDARERITAINVVQFDQLCAQHGNASKAQKPKALTAQQSADRGQPGRSYNDALREKGWLEVEQRRLELARSKGELIPIAAVMQSLADCSAVIVKVIERLPAQSDDLAASVGRDGTHGLRVALKKLADQMRREIADAVSAVGARPIADAPGAE